MEERQYAAEDEDQFGAQIRATVLPLVLQVAELHEPVPELQVYYNLQLEHRALVFE